MRESPKAGPRFGADLILPVVASLYAIYYVASVWDFPPEAQLSGMVLAALLLALTTLFFLRTIVQVVRTRARFDLSPVLGPRSDRGQRLLFIALTVIYPFVVSTGGFVLTTFGFVLAGSLLAGLRPLGRAALFAAAAALGGWLFFIVLLGTRFPEGPFERLVAAVTSWS